MVQVQVREAQGLDYPRAIRSVLRHDPDVIMIGEVRDSMSATIALGAASSGHLTISSVHMPSALHIFERLRSFSIDAGSVANSVSVVLNQRLLPKLCERCKEVEQRGPCGVTHKANGCGACGDTGFSGRVLVTELLDLQSPEVKEISGRAGSIRELLERIPSAAYVPWTSSLQHHLLAGHISAAQVDAFVEEEM
jgi:general secretion pathway protein E